MSLARPQNLQRRCIFSAALGVLAAIAFAQPTSAATYQHTTLHNFGGLDGAGDLTGLIADESGALYGATAFGGTGAGLVFKVTPGKSGYTEKTIYEFRGGEDGATPEGIVAGAAGSVYGLTFVGGNPGNGGFGWGTVFKLTPGQSGYTKTTLYKFTSSQDGFEPVGSPVLDAAGDVFGVTSTGGLRNAGTVFELTLGKSGYTKRMLYEFPGNGGGGGPSAGLTIDANGALYGTASYGGFIKIGPCDGGCGLVFKLTPDKSAYTESVLYKFIGGPADSNMPVAPVTIDEHTGVIYGTTQYGGIDEVGTVFKLTPMGSGYTNTLLHSFTGNTDGFLPEGQLLLRPNGSLYGTVRFGGGGCRGIGCGVVFELASTGSTYSFNFIYDFRYPKNGADPEGSNLIMDASGALYGTTRSGGTATHCSDGGPGSVTGCGTVFKLTP